MKTRRFTLLIAMSLFAALAMPAGMAAQDNPSPDNKPKHKKYRLIDMGTFGGPASYVGFPFNTWPALNPRGMVVGASATPVATLPTSDFFVCGGSDGAVPNVFHGFLRQGNTVTDLGALPPNDENCSFAGAINAAGEIVGSSEKDEIDPLLGVKEFHGVVWKNSQIRDLGTFGGSDSFALSINDRGDVVGAALNTVPDPVSLIYFAIFGLTNGTQFRASLWRNGVIHDLGTLGGPDAVANFVNQREQITGYSYTNDAINPTTGLPTIHPFLWNNGKMIDLGSLGGTLAGFGGANMLGGINNRGEVVGTSTLAGDLTVHPFLWRQGVLEDLGTLGGDNGQAAAINDAGDVVGEADLPSSLTHDAFLWRHGSMTDLGNLGQTSFAFAINSKRQVGGHSLTNDGTFRAFLWDNGGPMVDLNTLIPSNSSLQLIEVVAINDAGEIAGIGVPAGCSSQDEAICGHAYLLIPDGDCDGDCQERVEQSQAEAEIRRQSASAMTQRTEAPISPIERVRSMMRQRYHLPGQPAAPRD